MLGDQVSGYGASQSGSPLPLPVLAGSSCSLWFPKFAHLDPWMRRPSRPCQRIPMDGPWGTEPKEGAQGAPFPRFLTCRAGCGQEKELFPVVSQGRSPGHAERFGSCCVPPNFTHPWSAPPSSGASLFYVVPVDTMVSFLGIAILPCTIPDRIPSLSRKVSRLGNDGDRAPAL